MTQVGHGGFPDWEHYESIPLRQSVRQLWLLAGSYQPSAIQLKRRQRATSTLGPQSPSPPVPQSPSPLVAIS
jgi:hypothetical protein